MSLMYKRVNMAPLQVKMLTPTQDHKQISYDRFGLALCCTYLIVYLCYGDFHLMKYDFPTRATCNSLELEKVGY